MVTLSFMRLVTFSRDGGAVQAGVISGDKISALGSDMISVIAYGKPAATGPSYNLSDVTLLAPIPRPPKLICVGLNYRDHAAETNMEIPKVPTIFNKFPNVVIGPGASIVLPKVSERPDYESRVCFRHRTRGTAHSGFARDGACLRIHHCQRRERSGLSDGYFAVAHGQDI